MDEVASFIENYPADEEGVKDVVCSLEFETGSCIPIAFTQQEGIISVYTISCDDNRHLVNSTGVENERYVAGLPCYTNAINLDTQLQELNRKVADAGGWNADETSDYNRSIYDNYLIRASFNLNIE